MQSNAAHKLETLEQQSPSTTPAEAIPLRLPVEAQAEEGVKKTLTRERIEEAVGAVFITLMGFLAAWFYYLLYISLAEL